jgi:DNA polymerase-3 subunit delta
MPDTISAFDFLSRDKMSPVPPVCVLFGEEPLLKHESLERLRSAVLQGEDGELSFTVFEGGSVEPREVFDELATVSMFGGGRRMVLLEDADKFVAKYRSNLEDYCDKPRAASVLVLEVESWASNTRLFKKLAQTGLQINCNLPRQKWGDTVDEEPVLEWLTLRATTRHQAKLAGGAGELLLEIVGPQLGRLDQELAKLALLAGAGQPGDAAEGKKQKAEGNKTHTITRELVEQAVGGWRAKTAWGMIEAALEGNAREALVQLDRLLLAGEEPIALFAMMSGSLRRMAAAARIVQQSETQSRRITLPQALQEAGVTPRKFVLDKAERQLRQIGRHRAAKIYRWLLGADLALKGASSSGDRARMVLEQLIVRLSQPMAAPSTATR